MNLKTKYKKLKRSEKIINVFIKYGLGYLIDRSKLKLLYKIKKNPDDFEAISLPERISLSLEELGPTFIKFGQILSMRPDFLPSVLIKELEKLQDEVPAFDSYHAREIVEQELGMNIEKLFKEFEEIPIASASLSQVHRAVLPNGDIVAVKIQRPDIKETIELDLEILKDLMGFMDRRLGNNWVYHPQLIIKEFKKAIQKEIDFTNEAQNHEKFRINFKDISYIKIPKIYWDMTTKKVLTMEFIEGVKINEITSPEYIDIFDPKEVARRGAYIILKQVFEDGFFHADPHPANIFILPPATIAMLDVGQVGYVDENIIRNGAKLLQAMMDKDLDQSMQCLKDLGILGKDFNEILLRQDFTELIESYVGIPLKDIEVKKFAQDTIEVMVHHNLVLPSNLALMIKALSMAETTGRQLDPDFNIVTIGKPFITKIVNGRFSPDQLLKKGNIFVKDSIGFIEKLPRDLTDTIKKLLEGKLKFIFENKELEKLTGEINRSAKSISLSIVIASLIIGSSLIMLLNTGPIIFGYPIQGVIGYIIAVFLSFILTIILISKKGK
ncbi:MAG: AarF/ABC1/UbiB kinase family protein [Actinomycetota bacterium]|nr:AarF/ABC1/UbiB kinase family protein [Actinomycetota bacterium]